MPVEDMKTNAVNEAVATDVIESGAEQEQAKTIEPTGVVEPKTDADKNGKKVGRSTRKRRKEIKAALKPIMSMVEVESGALNQDEIVKSINSWAAEQGKSDEEMRQIVEDFEIMKENVSTEIPAEYRIEIVCALAEIVAEGNLDAETLRLLAAKIEYGGESGTMDKVVSYQPIKPKNAETKIVIYAELCEQIDGGKQNIQHIIKHEIGHGLARYGEIFKPDERRALLKKIRGEEGEAGEKPKISEEIYQIIEQAENYKDIETYHLTNVLNRYLIIKNNPATTNEAREKAMVATAEEIIAEKTAIYLSSDGEFSDFLLASLAVTSGENIGNIFEQSKKAEYQAEIEKLAGLKGEEMQAQIAAIKERWPNFGRFVESNKTFFDLISERLKDKTAVKEKVKANISAAGGNVEGDLDDWDDYFEGGFYDPGIPASKDDKSGGKGNSEDLAVIAELAGAFGNAIEEVLPVSEFKIK